MKIILTKTTFIMNHLNKGLNGTMNQWKIAPWQASSFSLHIAKVPCIYELFWNIILKYFSTTSVLQPQWKLKISWDFLKKSWKTSAKSDGPDFSAFHTNQVSEFLSTMSKMFERRKPRKFLEFLTLCIHTFNTYTADLFTSFFNSF